MDSYRLTVYAHLILSIVLVGLALFWFVMRVALRRSFPADKSLELLQVVNRARWPHVAVPYALRLPLPFMSWAVIALLIATGLALVHQRGAAPEGLVSGLKLAGVTVIVIMQVLVTRRPRPALIGFNLIVVLLTILFSGWMIR